MTGLGGVYYQGHFWASGVVAAMNPGEDALALGLPTLFTAGGSFIVSYVILASPLTASWDRDRRLQVFAAFAVVVLGSCVILSRLAGTVAAKVLQTT